MLSKTKNLNNLKLRTGTITPTQFVKKKAAILASLCFISLEWFLPFSHTRPQFLQSVILYCQTGVKEQKEKKKKRKEKKRKRKESNTGKGDLFTGSAGNWQRQERNESDYDDDEAPRTNEGGR